MITVMVLVVVMVSSVMFVSVVYGFDEKPCSVHVTSNLYPIEYNNNKRSNPDGSAYPGDGFHYIFYFEGTNTCQGFHAKSIQSKGAFDVLSHDIITGNGQMPKVHPHKHTEIAPKYLKTTHYYDILQSETDCTVHKGGKSTCHTNYVLSDNPIFSVREDHKLTSIQEKRIFQYLKTSQSPSAVPHLYLRDDIKTVETFAWALTNVVKGEHTHDENTHTLEDDSSTISFDDIVERRCLELKKNAGCVWGHIEVDTDFTDRKCLKLELYKIGVMYEGTLKDECLDVKNTVSLTVHGTEIRCYFDDGVKTCKNIIKKKTAELGVDVLSPVPDVTFERPAIKDIDGYDSKNQDSTYYVWDVPAIHTKPKLPFQELRDGTISFEIIRTATPIPEVYTTNCDGGDNGTCLVIVSGDYVMDTAIDAINGDRIDAFRAETLDEQGLHTIPYHITTYNIGREISETSNSTDILIVDYTPVFSKNYFPYTILDTPGNITFEKQHGVSLHYLGSKGTGPDDKEIIHENRRSKINDSHHAIVANSLSRHYILNSTVLMQGGNDITDMVNSVHDSVLESSGITLEKYQRSLVSISDTAVFENMGFGRMAFSFEDTEEIKRYSIANITTYNTLGSSQFGGYEIKYLLNYPYNHPGSYLSSIFNITAINSDGSINEEMKIDGKLEIVHAVNETVHISQYMYSHIENMKSRDVTIDDELFPKEFAQMYLGDMYDVSNAGFGTGSVVIPINLPAVHIDSELWGVLGIDNQTFTTLDEEFVFSSPVAYQLNITAGKTSNVIPYYPYGFSYPINYTINSDDDGNTLESVRYLSLVHVRSPDSFGEIKEITINGKKYEGPCSHQCLLGIDGNATVHAENIWGGTATLDVIKQRWDGTSGGGGGGQYELVVAYVDNVGPIVILVLVVFTVLFLYGKFARSR